MLSKTKNAPTMRRKEVKRTSQKKCNPIIAFLTKKTEYGDPYWAVGVFMFGLLNLMTAGAPIIWTLYFMGVL